MPGRAFFDTNILIYALAKGDPRSVRAEELLAAGGVLSIQILNEFVSVARRKIQMSWSEVAEALGAIRVLCSSPLPLTVDTHETALKIAEKHGYGIYDALAVARRLKLIARRSTPTFRMARQSMAKSRSEIRLLLDLLRNPHRLRSLAKSGFTHYVSDDHVALCSQGDRASNGASRHRSRHHAGRLALRARPRHGATGRESMIIVRKAIAPAPSFIPLVRTFKWKERHRGD